MSLDVTGTERAELYAFALHTLKERGAKRVLDVACGNGEGTSEIAAGLPNAQVVGMDLSNELINDAKKHTDQNLSFVVADARTLPVRDGEFDAVVSCHTIEHFTEADQHRLTEELHRVLTPGGFLVIATPDREVWELQGIAGMQEDHIRELSQSEFVSIIEAHGFTVEGRYGQGLLKEGSFPLRRVLNTVKRLDVFKLRKLLGGSLQTIDSKTQPVRIGTVVEPLPSGARASVTVLVCRKR